MESIYLIRMIEIKNYTWSRLVFDIMSLRQISSLALVFTNFADVCLLGYNDLSHTEETLQYVCLANQTMFVSLSYTDALRWLCLLFKFQMLEIIDGRLIYRLFMFVWNKHRDTTYDVRTDTKNKWCISVVIFMFVRNRHLLKMCDLIAIFMSIQNRHMFKEVI